MKLSYKKDYHYALIKISDLELKNSKLLTDISYLSDELYKSNKQNDNLIRKNNNLITQNKLLIADNEKLIDEIKSLNLKVAKLEEQVKNSYTFKKVRPGRPVKPQTMKIRSSVTSRSQVRNYLNKEFNYEES